MNYFEQDCFRYNVLLELSPIELEKIYKDKINPLSTYVEDRHFLTLLCEKWKIENVDIFDKFFLEWNLNYLFSRHATLEYQLENYKKYFTVSKAASKASKNSQRDFCEALVEQYPGNKKILYNIHKNYVYRENPLELITKLSLVDRYGLLSHFLRKGYELKDIFVGETYTDDIMRYNSTIADIAFRRPLLFQDIVHLPDIANFLKDPSVLTDPYYINHPNVNSEFSIENLLQLNSYRFLELCKIEEVKQVVSFTLSKKSCKVFEEIGMPRDMFLTIGDEYSYCWLRKHGSKYGYVVRKPKEFRERTKTLFSIITLNERTNSSCETSLVITRDCPSFIEYIQRNCSID